MINRLLDLIIRGSINIICVLSPPGQATYLIAFEVHLRKSGDLSPGFMCYPHPQLRICVYVYTAPESINPGETLLALGWSVWSMHPIQT